MLTKLQIEQFIYDGFVKIENAFPVEIAKECCNILWPMTGCLQNDRSTWTEPVIRIGELSDEPFIEAANTSVLIDAYNQLVGNDNWIPKNSLGTFPIRFPSKIIANDTGWHVDASFPGDEISDYFKWRINIHSKARGLLMLFLFSDIGEMDAPTILKNGSHRDVAKILAPYQDDGLSFIELSEKLDSNSPSKTTFATGKAGTVYLCHPFMVHSAQNHKGDIPKFMAQPALMTKNDFSINKNTTNFCPVEIAIWKALH